MKRSWIGLGLLLVLLALGIVTTWAMEKIHAPIESQLQQAAVFALEENWAQADAASQSAISAWDKWEHFRACLADHTPVEEIDAGLEELKIYAAARENAAFAAACAELGRKIAAVGEAHGLVWWNIL